MEKKRIKKEDLELNFEVLSSTGLKGSETVNTLGAASNNTCASNLATCNTCGGTIKNCDTTLTSIANCQTTEDGDGCNTQETFICETQNCVDSKSNAELCCVATQQNGCQNTAMCVSYITCGNTNDICLVTNNNCQVTQGNECPTYKTVILDGCEPPVPVPTLNNC